MKYPDKYDRYVYKDGSVFEIWEDEDFSNNDVLLYDVETGEDITVKLKDFKKYFKKKK